MSWKELFLGVGCVALAYGQATAADPVVSSYVASQPGTIVLTQAEKGAPVGPQTPPRPAPPAPPVDTTVPPSTDAFSQAPPAGTEMGASADPQMLGDSIGYVIGRGTSLSSSGSSSSRLVSGLDGSGFKIADNESPTPQDRVFMNVDWYTGVLHTLIGPGGAAQRLTREVFGFEKTFLDGNASIEVRAPLFETNSEAGASTTDFGDLTIIGKYALLNNHSNGEDTVLTAGASITLPTGPNTDPAVGLSVNPTILQPYVGGLIGNQDLYVHGFSSFAIPFSNSEPTVWFADLGVGYYAYRSCDGCLRAIVPTVESHLSIALGKEGTGVTGIGFIDAEVVTGGVHFVFEKHSTLTLGYELPVSGPQPFQSEYVLQFNYSF